MTRINALRNLATTRDSVAWGSRTSTTHNASTLIFAAVLIVCSVTVGCSSSNNDQPKAVSSNNQIPIMPTPSPIASAPVMLAETKAPKKVVHKKPATVNYTDKNSGVTFEYPRRYAIETGDAATDLLTSSPIPMNFVMPGGVALAAVELPQTSFANTDFSSAFFNVSLNKTLTADQCNQFAVPQPKIVEAKSTESTTAIAATTATVDPKSTSPETQPAADQPTVAQSAPAPVPATTTMTASSDAAPSAPQPQGSKLMLGDLELHGTEAVAGEGTRQSDSKYFHVFQNGSCYEFGLNVTTIASDAGVTKHVDRDKVFGRLEQILSTVKINPLTPAAPEVTAETKAAPAVSETPAQ